MYLVHQSRHSRTVQSSSNNNNSFVPSSEKYLLRNLNDNNIYTNYNMKIYPIDMICTKVSGCIIIKGPACPLPSLLQTAHITVSSQQ